MTTRNTKLGSIAVFSMISTAFAVALAASGCSDSETGSCAQGSCTGQAGIGGTSGAGGSGGSSAGTGGSGGEIDAGPEVQCGGFASLKCPDPTKSFCDYPETAECGAGDVPGVCKPRPASCAAGGPTVCGCDGKSYLNACEAHAGGTDDHPNGSCSNP
ncbi:MAG: hypothetical protein ABW133_06160 [Polyangiaceae bacterium]